MNSAEPTRYVYDFDAPPEGSEDDRRRLLGGKGANLVVMSSELRLPVPPGFVISTAACLAYLGGSWPDGLDTQIRTGMDRLGERLGRRFGDIADPLLVSVRSGAPVSMPGMMDTILNLGLTDATVAGLARVSGDEFAADCLRRFREGYAAVIGSSVVPDDPWQQLRAAIEAVFKSWNSDRARAYRAREAIADDLGTAVTVQAMVFGNRGEASGTGVLFTRNPSTGADELYGDVLFNAQGEDVVAGTHAPSPIGSLDAALPSVAQELRGYAGLLERHLTDVADIEFTIEDGRLWMLQVRTGKKSPRAALRMAAEMAADESFPLSRADAVARVLPLLADPPRVFVRSSEATAPITHGLPASPGVAHGGVVTSSAAAIEAGDRGESVILVREETSPEDVTGMAKAVGVLTARGGLASHAAVVARGWGIPAVVGATDVRPSDGHLEIAGRTLFAGDVVTIDGSTGEVFLGELAGEWQVAPEAATLLEWANELGIEVGRGDGSDTAADAGAAVASGGPESGLKIRAGGRGGAADGGPSTADGGGAAASAGRESSLKITADDVHLALAVKGAVTLDQLSEATLAEAAALEHPLAELVSAGLAENATGQLRLTATGKLAASDLFNRSRAVVGDSRSEQLLEEFHVLDARMKSIVTAWQVRDVGGEQTFNDHSEAAYDAQVMDDMAALHRDTEAWLSPLAGMIARFSVYFARLGRALELADRGDQRYVASPRVDSYHSVWFELHEDLIRLAGKKRSEATTG